MSVPICLFADDITLIAESTEHINLMLADLAAALSKAGLTLQPSTCVEARNLYADGGKVHLGQVELQRSVSGVVKVLGVQVDLNGGENTETEFKKTRAWSSFWRFRRILTHKDAPLSQRL
eukprot:4923867-Alexandrium_andersonii.AAC.1